MTLAQGRDIAAIILVAEMFVLALILLAAFHLAIRGMQRLLPKLRYWLRLSCSWVLRAERILARLMRWLLAPVLLISGLSAGLREGVAALRRR